MVRATAWGVAPILAIALIVQVTSYALFGGTAARQSIPAHLSAAWPFDLTGTAVARIPAFRRELAAAALLRDDTARAATLLAGAGSGDDADDLRGRVADAGGDLAAAAQAYGRAGDIVRARTLIDGVAARDPLAALHLAETFDRVAAARDVPAAVIAQSDWREGELAAQVADAAPGGAPAYVREALARYEAAARLDPTQDAYGLSTGFEAIVAGDDRLARDAYARVVAHTAQSIDGLVGLAVASALTGDCPNAVNTYAHARSLAALQHVSLGIERAGYGLRAQRAFARCAGSGEPTFGLPERATFR